MKYMLFTYRDPGVPLDRTTGQPSRPRWLPGVTRCESGDVNVLLEDRSLVDLRLAVSTLNRPTLCERAEHVPLEAHTTGVQNTWPTTRLRSICARGGTSTHRRMSLRGGPLQRSR
jgi:hypothetical protein